MTVIGIIQCFIACFAFMLIIASPFLGICLLFKLYIWLFSDKIEYQMNKRYIAKHMVNEIRKNK